MSMARTCMHAHIVGHVHTRAHAKKTPMRRHTQHAHVAFAPAHAKRRGAHILDIRRSKPATLTAHLRRASLFLSAIEDSKCCPASEEHVRWFASPQPPLALPPRVWSTVPLRHATPAGREMRESENRLRNARRACTGRLESDDSCAPVRVATSRVDPPATRWPTVKCSCAMPHQRVEKPKVGKLPAPSRHRSPTLSQTVRGSRHALPLPCIDGRKIGCAHRPCQHANMPTCVQASV